MGRWLVAVVVVVSALAAGAIAFQTGHDPITIRLAPGRAVVLPSSVALALAFAAGGAVAAALALGGAAARRWRAWRRRRTADRSAARLRAERVRAEALLVAGHDERAHDHLQQAVSTHGPDERLLELLAGASERRGDVAGAIAAVEEARRRVPGSPLLARRLVSLYAAAGRWEDALALAGTVLQQPLSPAALEAERVLVCGLRYEASLADANPPRGLRRLLALAREHPDFVPAWVAAGDRLREAGRTFRARRVYERGARARPATVLLDRLVAMHDAGGRPERARQALQRIARRHPDDVELVAYLVRRDLRNGALADAEALLSRWPAAEEAPAAIEALRGELYRRTGQPERALVHFARAAATCADSPDRQRCPACGHVRLEWSARCERCGRWDAGPAALHERG